MRYANIPLVSTGLQTNQTSSPTDMRNILKISAQVVAGSGSNISGTVQLQVCDDPIQGNLIFADNTFTNWSNLGSAVTLSGAGVTLIAQQDMCYQALRAVYTNTFATVSTITAVRDRTAAVKAALTNQSLTYTAVTAGAAGNSITLQLIVTAVVNQPQIISVVGNAITVTLANDGTGTPVESGDFLKGQLNADPQASLLILVTGSNGSALGALATTPLAGGIDAHVLNNTYFLASSTTADYYFWFSNGTGVDPAIAGRTAIPVTYTDNDSANTIGGLIRTAAASKGWTVTGANAQAILTNSPAGASLPCSDGAVPTGFTFANTQSSGTLAVNLFEMGI